MNTSRRTVLTTAAWSVPAITVASAAPAFATSTNPRKDPGINGWVQVSWNKSTEWVNPKRKTVVNATFDSDPAGNDPATPDGSPFGLYIFDAIAGDLFSAASITLWFRGEVGSWGYGPSRSRTNDGGHGNKWSSPVSVGTRTQPDGLIYHGYRFDYTGDFVLSGGLTWLQDIEITATNVASGDATFWVERHIAINGEMHAFQRRNGERGPLGQGFPVGRMSASAQSVAAGGQGLV